jgi:hypothetical protein
MFDETTDSQGRAVLNILIGECSELERKSPVLVKCVEIKKTDSLNVNLSIIEVLNILYEKDTSKYLNLCLLLSDRATYAIKAGKCLKKSFLG